MNVQDFEQKQLRSRGINAGTPPVGNALEVECDRCYVPAGTRCHDRDGRQRPAHPTRARAARWSKMMRHDLQFLP